MSIRLLPSGGEQARQRQDVVPNEVLRVVAVQAQAVLQRRRCASRVARVQRRHLVHEVTNDYSDLILELFGPDVGAHARSSIGMVIPMRTPS